MSIKEKLGSLDMKTLADRLLATLKRFWSLLLCAAGICTVSIASIHHVDWSDSTIFGILFLCTEGMIIDFLMIVWAEEHPERKTAFCIARSIIWALLIGIATCIIMEVKLDFDKEAFILGILSVQITIMLLIPFVSFLKKGTDIEAWHFTRRLILYLLLAFFVYAIICIGVGLLIFGILALFDISLDDEKVLFDIAVGVLWFAYLLFLLLVPSGEKKHDNTQMISKVLNGVIKYVLLVLLVAYIIVLYAYTLKIIFTWELPKGMVSWCVTAVMVLYIICYTGLYPILNDKDSRISKIMRVWLPSAILPLLVLMTVGLIRRFADYGITVPRLYVATALVWYYAVCISMLCIRAPRFRWIFSSLAILLLITSAQPFNFSYINHKVHINKFQRMIEPYGLTIPLDWDIYSATLDSLPPDIKDNIQTEEHYLLYHLDNTDIFKEEKPSWIETQPLEETQSSDN